MAQECAQRLALRGKTLRDATDHFLACLETQTRSIRVSVAVEQFLSGKRDRIKPMCPAGIQSVRRLLKPLAARGGEKMVCDVSAKDCEEWMSAAAISVSNANSLNHQWREFFKWCAAKARRYSTDNPCSEIAFIEPEEMPVGILTPEQLARLLECAPPEALAYIAIGAFAGLRSKEIERLDWKEIDFEDGCIEVTARKSKTATRRLVKILPCLRAWIEPLAKRSGPIVPPVADAIFRMMVRARSRAQIEEWPKNALRHSFASYHMAAFKDAAALALEMGHTTTTQIFKHYRQVVRESQGIQWWNIMPAEPENVLRFAEGNREYVTSEDRRRRAGGGRFQRSAIEIRKSYEKSARAYAKEYGVQTKIITKWQRMGKPLDNPEAMARLERREYDMTERQHADAYGVSIETARWWRRHRWPLDDVASMTNFLTFRREISKVVFGPAKNRAVRVIGLGAKDARAAAEAAGNDRLRSA